MGTPGPKARSASERFWEKVERSDGCWIWQGKRNARGYGIFTLHNAGRTTGVGAHRMAYTFTNGAIRDGLFVLHRCDNPPCVNPAHLFLGDQTANMSDASRKGRLVREPAPLATECRRGHEMTAANTYVWNDERHCRTCRDIAEARRQRPRRPPKPRPTHCRSGHKYTAANTYLYRGLRFCRACRAVQESKRRKHAK